jgi:hypothetical protein
MKLLDCAESVTEKNRAETDALRRQQKQQQEIDELRRQIRAMKFQE